MKDFISYPVRLTAERMGSVTPSLLKVDFPYNCKSRRISRSFKPEEISTKLGVGLYDRDKIQTFSFE